MKTSKNILFNIFLLITLGLFALACDTNIAKPADLETDLDVSVSAFTVDDDSITLGEATTVHWNITDTNKQVSYIQITPEVGTKTATSGAQQVKPSLTTTYTLTVFAGSEAVVSRSLQVSVVSAAGSEITETPEAEVCTDTKDNDFDEKADCEDTDCAEDDTCQEAPLEYSITASYTPDPAVLNKEVTVAWTSTNCKNVTVTDTAGGIVNQVKDPAGEYKFTPTTQDTYTISLICLDASDVGQGGTYNLYITAITDEICNDEIDNDLDGATDCDDSDCKLTDDSCVDFSATKNTPFSITPSSSLIYGEEYSLLWNFSNTSNVTLNDATVSGASEEGDHSYTATENMAYTLTVYDTNDLVQHEDYHVNVNVSSFGNGKKLSTDAGTFSGTITSVVPGASNQTYYFITDDKVYKTTDALSTGLVFVTDTSVIDAAKVNANAAGTIKAVAETSGGSKVYIGTTEGLFVYDGSAVKEIASTEGRMQINAIAISGDRVLVGSSTQIFEVISGDTGVQYLSFPVTTAIEIKLIMVNPNNTDQILVLTASSVYYSNDGGSSFSSVPSSDEGFTAISWNSSDGSCFLWNDDVVASFDPSQNSLSDVNKLSGTATINNVLKQSGRYFVATADGVSTYHSDLDDAIFDTDLRDGKTVKFIVPGKSTSVMTKTLYAITSNGTQYTLAWKKHLEIAFPIPSFDFKIKTPGDIDFGAAIKAVAGE